MKSENNELSLIKQLRELTQAGMKDCKDSLTEANWDLQKAVDLVKKKGLNVVSGREGKVAAEGIIKLCNVDPNGKHASLIEANCQTDFVANSKDFLNFVNSIASAFEDCAKAEKPFTSALVENLRQEVVSTTKENIVVRRWCTEEVAPETDRCSVFTYLHSNNKIGVILTLVTFTENDTLTKSAVGDLFLSHPELKELGSTLAMQVAAMNPIAVESNRLPEAVVTRQLAIFEEQLKELNKPQAAWSKIIEGKSRKWHTEVCLLDQESITVPKSSVRQVIKNIGDKLGCEITVLNFVRFEVGEGIEVTKSNLADEVSKMSGVHQHSRQGMPGACKDCPKD